MSIVLPEGIIEIDTSTFEGCSSLTKVTIPSTVTSIGSSAFRDCSSLTSITIPSLVTSIGSYAFYNCYKLAEVYNLSNLTITAGETTNGYVGYYAHHIYTSVDSPSNQQKVGDYVFYFDNEVMYLLSYAGNDTELSLPSIDEVKKVFTEFTGSTYQIHDYAFYINNKITSVTIPSCVVTIGKYAFHNCTNLTTVTFKEGSGLTSIGDRAFSACSALLDINLPEGLREINGYAFYNCNRLTNITIPDGVTSIGMGAFLGCEGLTNITIPNSMTNIGNAAFYWCNSLKKIYYTGTAEEWSAINIGSNNAPLTSATVYYYCYELTEEQKADGNNYWRYVDGVPTAWTKETT